jgi:hypothetical protein
MSAAMQDGDDQSAVVIDSIEDAERKSVHECAAGAAMDDREQVRTLRDPRKRGGRLVEKLVPESLALLFVPNCRFRQIALRFGPETDPRPS